MAKISIDGDTLVVEMEGFFEKAMALKSALRVPLSHVKAARPNPGELMDDTFIIRVFGASLIQTHIGYFWKKDDGMVFIDVHNLKGGSIVAFDLEHEKMKHLYIECDKDETADAVAARINAARAG